MRFHPWIFSGAVSQIKGNPKDGEIVEVWSNKGKYLATGHYQKGSICVRLFSLEKTTATELSFWKQKFEKAKSYRQSLGLLQSTTTNCYRLIHAEGDACPGLVVDIYNKTAVLQCHSIGMYLQRKLLAQSLQAVYRSDLEAIYNKSEAVLPKNFAASAKNSYLWGSYSEGLLIENGHRFKIDWETGQKTGFFLDQRDNRALLSKYAEGKSVLNNFCYSGAFSIYALKAGAKKVDSVDVSAKAILLTNENVDLNFTTAPSHRVFTADVLKFLSETNESYDVMIVDPPAFAKSLKKRHNAVQAYKRLNVLALKKITSGGILFTFSCSQVVDKKLFYNTIVAAAIEARRQVKVMHHLTQAADHPVSLFHPEGAYLKGLVLYVQ